MLLADRRECQARVIRSALTNGQCDTDTVLMNQGLLLFVHIIRRSIRLALASRSFYCSAIGMGRDMGHAGIGTALLLLPVSGSRGGVCRGPANNPERWIGAAQQVTQIGASPRARRYDPRVALCLKICTVPPQQETFPP